MLLPEKEQGAVREVTPTSRLPIDSQQATLRPPLLYQVLATTAYFLLTPVGSAQTHPLPPRCTNAHPKSRPQLGAHGTWSQGPGSSVSITSAMHNSGFCKGPGATAQAPRSVGTPTWPGSGGFAPPAVYLYPVCNPPSRRERGTRRARRGMTDGKGGVRGRAKPSRPGLSLTTERASPTTRTADRRGNGIFHCTQRDGEEAGGGAIHSTGRGDAIAKIILGI